MSVVADPPRPLYHSPLGLFPFQGEAAAYGYLREANYVVYDTGIGKTHIGMATSALLFEDDLIDLVWVVAEQPKIDDWRRDFERYTDLTAKLYHGPRRGRVLDDPPQVVISTYETTSRDCAEKNPNKPRAYRDKPLVGWLRGRRVLFVFDEITGKLRNRSSGLYKGLDHTIRLLRKRGGSGVRVMGLTATPVERNPESTFNSYRLLHPSPITVEEFGKRYILAWDDYQNAKSFMNIGEGDKVRDESVPTFSSVISDIMLRKSKFDDDVIDQFPRRIEEDFYIPLSDDHLDLYDTVSDLYAEREAALFTVQRMLAGHPLSLAYSEGAMAQEIVGAVGVEALRRIGSTKADRLVDDLTRMVIQEGQQVVVFTFFGQSILPVLSDRLRAEGLRHVVHHGALSLADKERAKASFVAGDSPIFLSSDAGARGLNFGNACYVINYEYPLTHANLVQRIDRVHRIDSRHPAVTAYNYIAPLTVEEGIVALNQQRNEWHDLVLGDDEDGASLSAADRAMMRKLARRRDLTKEGI